MTDILETVKPFIVANMIGLLIGIERERSQSPKRTTMGVRTFSLLALLGCLTASVQNILVAAVITLFTLFGILLGYYRATQSALEDVQKVGLTTEFAAGLVFVLGYIAPQEPLLVAILACIILLILSSRETLHRFSRKTLQPNEIKATILILFILFGILPFLPNRSIDPYGIFNPQRVGVLVAIISVLQFTGYIAIRIFGHRMGIALTGFFGGLVSSTLMFIQLPKLYGASSAKLRPCIAGATLATVASLLQATIILYAVSATLAHSLLPILGCMIIVGGLLSLLILKNGHNHQLLDLAESPLELRSVLSRAAILCLFLIIVGVVSNVVGNQGVQVTSFLGGLFDLRSISFADVNLFSEHKIDFQSAQIAVIYAVIASIISKLALLGLFNRNRLGLGASIFILLMLASGTLGYFLMNVTIL